METCKQCGDATMDESWKETKKNMMAANPGVPEFEFDYLNDWLGTLPEPADCQAMADVTIPMHVRRAYDIYVDYVGKYVDEEEETEEPALVKVLKVSHNRNHSYYCDDAQGGTDFSGLASMLQILLEEGTEGDKISFELTHIKQSDLDSMPDFQGW